MKDLHARIVVRVLFAASLFLLLTSIASSQTAAPGSTAAMRKCVESGRSFRVCFAETASDGFPGFSLSIPVPPGVRMSGDYVTAQGLRMIFMPDVVKTVCRGVLQPFPYTVDLSGAQPQIKLGSGIALTLRADGKLSGTGALKVTGEVITGSRIENGVAYTPANDIVYTQKHITEVATKTVDCSLGVFNVLGPTPLPPDIDNPFGYLGAIFSGMNALSQGKGTQGAVKEMLGTDKAPAPGLRMNGRYGSVTGFSMAFHPESVTLGCGEAEQALEYSVKRTATETLLTVQKPGGPVTVQLKPDGSLAGNGPVQVNGRKVVGTTEDSNNPFIFSPVVSRCELGSLALDTRPPGAQNTGSTGAPKATTGMLSISTSFQGHPLINKPIIFFKENIEDLLRKQGFQPPPGQSGKRPIDLYADACKNKDPRCEAANQALAAKRVNVMNTDANGRVFANSVPPGDYWVVTAIGSNGHSYMWNIHVSVTAGQESALSLMEMNTAVDW